MQVSILNLSLGYVIVTFLNYLLHLLYSVYQGLIVLDKLV